MRTQLAFAILLAGAEALVPTPPRFSARRGFLTVGLPSIFGFGIPVHALVKGSTPPPKGNIKSERGSCKTMDECEAVGRLKEDELFSDSSDGGVKTFTPEGDSYKDIVLGTGPEVTAGTTVEIKYRVMRLGKRSRDGLSGEASPVFSLGYGEDDDTEKDKLTVVMRQGNVVPAIYSGLIGTRMGGRRRINVTPLRGWKLPDNTCLKTYTDITIVPGTQVQENDACFADNLLPKPNNYGARRRMLRRYDETLIVDCEIVNVVPFTPERVQAKTDDD
mmetsp:Transcript_3540/g.6988  ORF Transcript_3540/g.6988 Transcript_3540/m.6988 type:complete len:275 (-) Transcript_3540:257-1081(-)